MRRYAVRFLVAVLTFGLGVTLSLVLGLFKPQDIRYATTWTSKKPCPKFRVSRPDFLTVDTELSDPLRIVYLGDSPDGYMKFLVENRADQPIAGFSLRGNHIWREHGTVDQPIFSWGTSELLAPGESTSITTVRRVPNAMSLRVSAVTFQSGFTWINPRGDR